jgi:GH3 auxin-responsive promoter
MLNRIRPILKITLGPMLTGLKTELGSPRRSQHRLLKKLISNLSFTDYGRSLAVRAGDDYDAFSSRVPIVGYDDISEWIERQKRKEKNALVCEPVLFYEKTSGSSGPAKYIPYTQSLKTSFNRMFLIWLCDLLRAGPHLQTGKTFISISPAFSTQEATGHGKRICLADDSEYLAGWARLLLKPFMVAPPAIKMIRDPINFRRALATMLAAEEKLEVISIWNPTMMEILLDYIEENREAIASDLKRGATCCEGIDFTFKPPRRDRVSLLKERTVRWSEFWPDLKLISCWASAHAAAAAARLGRRLPRVHMQPKGLLATEAPMTLPLIEAGGFVPLPGEVFYEFLDTEGQIKLLDELQACREYEIVLTQKGGLYRYRIGDLVRVTHFYQATPCLELVGRADAVCDLTGEKLNERFVEQCVTRLGGETSGFQMLLPVTAERGPSYYLLVVDALPDATDCFEATLDEALSESYHYRNSRRLGQLGPPRVRVTPGAREVYYEFFTKKGMKSGDIKHQYLIRNLEDAAKLLAMLNGSG